MNLAYEDVRQVLIKNDPEGLLRMGAPPDEYDDEAKRIYCSLVGDQKVLLPQKPSFQHVLEVVEYVFYTSFDVIDGSDVCWKKPQYSWLHDQELDAHFIAFEIHSLLK